MSIHKSNTQFKAKKSLGQNFLIDSNIIHKIVESCDLTAEDVVLEIGPGKGAITKAIAPRVKKLIAVEKDRDLAQLLTIELSNFDNISLFEQDILKYPFESLKTKTKLIGNLPYNISTPIIEKILTSKNKFSSIYIMVQLEYGQRLIAKPHTKDYSSFTLFVNYHADVKMLFKIKNGSFQPAPKVQSCFLKLTPKQPNQNVNDEKLLFHTIHSAFQQRRKTIENSLSINKDKQKITSILKSLKINEKLRAENLILEDYIRIANALGNEE